MTRSNAWTTRFLAGDPRALARALSLLEADDPRGEAVLRAVRSRARDARLIGLTGSPGAGKSTLADGLIAAWRARGERVAVLAIDPSSPFSGGALLGDRVRMTRWSGDAGVFVRSMASRGRTGGLAPRALAATTLLAAFGFDVVLLETVGVGQAEVDVAAVAHTTVVALAPGQGDDVQAAKAGLMEVADVFALTKADRPGADRLAREVRDAVALPAATSWRPPVVILAVGAPTSERPAAIAADGGVADLVAAIDAHAAHLAGGGDASRRGAGARAEVAGRAFEALQAALAAEAPARWQRVASGDVTAARAVADVLRAAADAADRAVRPDADDAEADTLAP
jgi:LAO/AO transport system kinase